MELLINEIEFKRIIIHVKGQVKGNKPGIKISFWNEAGGAPLTPTHVDWEGDSFHLWMNVLSINKESPMEPGIYYMGVYDGGKCVSTARLAEGVGFEEDELKDNPVNVVINKGKGHFFRAFSRLNLDTGDYYLDVRCEMPEEQPFFIKKWWSKHVKNWKRNAWEITHWISLSEFKHYAKKKKRGDQILFASGSRAELGGNEEFIYNRLVERGLDKNYRIKFDFKPNIDAKRSLIKKFKFTKLLATSDIIFIDDYYPDIYKFDYPKDVKVVQLWHACGAFKSLGFERMDKPGAPPLNTRVHKCYTHMPVSSVHSAWHHAEGFCIDESKFLPIGIARTDVFFDQDYIEKTKKLMYEQFPRTKDAKKVYLYAPTFRGRNALDAFFPYEKVDLNAWGKFLKERDEHLIIKMHPFVKQSLNIPEKYKDYISDAFDYREVNDILFIVDVLITDYSSVMYEFSLLRRPMYFYAFDQKMYEASRDFYEKYEDTVPGPIVKRFDELLSALKNETFDNNVLNSFIEKNFTYTDGKSTDRVIDEIILK